MYKTALVESQLRILIVAMAKIINIITTATYIKNIYPLKLSLLSDQEDRNIIFRFLYHFFLISNLNTRS